MPMCLSCARYRLPCPHETGPEPLEAKIKRLLASLAAECAPPEQIVLTKGRAAARFLNKKAAAARAKKLKAIRQALAFKSPYADAGLDSRKGYNAPTRAA